MNELCYSRVQARGHHRADKNGSVLEHILIAEKALGKPLPPGAIVHHLNGTRNSGPLVICQDENFHRLLHQRTRALKNCGHANWRKCKFCKAYDAPENLIIPLRKGIAPHHKSCLSDYNKKQYSIRKLGAQPCGSQ